MQTALSRLDAEERKEFWACLALRYAKGVGTVSIAKLVKHYGCAFDAVHNAKQWASLGFGVSGESIENDSWRKMATIEWENAKDLDAHIILWNSKEYPEDLHEIPEAPHMLYAKGNLDLLKNPCIGIVGSRSCTNAGEQIGEYMANALSLCGFTVASGMARGIDRSAHIGALKHSSSSIGVLGSGIDLAYPDINSDIYYEMRMHGLLLSEFAPKTTPDPRNFPRRNRIISGISQGIVVIEAGRKSGSTITAYKANDQGRNVYAVAGALGSATSLGCQQLIRHGAKPIFNVEDILEDIIPLVGAEAIEIDELLKKHSLSSENLFRHSSVLNPDKEEKKYAKKRFNHKNFAYEENIPQRFKDKARVAREKSLQNEDDDSDYSDLFVQVENPTSTRNRKEIVEKIKEPKAKKEKKSTKKEQQLEIIEEIENTNNLVFEKILHSYADNSLEYLVLSLTAEEKYNVDKLCQKTGKSPQELTVCLINLELNDHIQRYEGSWYGRKN